MFAFFYSITNKLYKGEAGFYTVHLHGAVRLIRGNDTYGLHFPQFLQKSLGFTVIHDTIEFYVVGMA